MNTAMPLVVRSISSQTALRAAALATLFSFASVAVFADQPWAPAAATRAAKVSLSGLDLSTAEGAHIAYERIKTTAERLCFQLATRGIDDHAVYNFCVIETVANTVRRINMPALVALEK